MKLFAKWDLGQPPTVHLPFSNIFLPSRNAIYNDVSNPRLLYHPKRMASFLLRGFESGSSAPQLNERAPPHMTSVPLELNTMFTPFAVVMEDRYPPLCHTQTKARVPPSIHNPHDHPPKPLTCITTAHERECTVPGILCGPFHCSQQSLVMAGNRGNRNSQRERERESDTQSASGSSKRISLIIHLDGSVYENVVVDSHHRLHLFF